MRHAAWPAILALTCAAQAGSFTLDLIGGRPAWAAVRTDEGAWRVQPADRPRYAAEMGQARVVEWVAVCGNAITHLKLRAAEHPGFRQVGHRTGGLGDRVSRWPPGHGCAPEREPVTPA